MIEYRVKGLYKSNGGVSAAQNSGIEMASGSFIYFVDGDDYVMPDYIEYMIEVIKQNLTIHSERIHEAWKYANWRAHSDFYDMCVLVGVEKEYSEMYKKCLKVTQKDALSALHVPTSKQNKLRTVIMWICPAAIPIAMRFRKIKYHVNVSNR